MDLGLLDFGPWTFHPPTPVHRWHGSGTGMSRVEDAKNPMFIRVVTVSRVFRGVPPLPPSLLRLPPRAIRVIRGSKFPAPPLIGVNSRPFVGNLLLFVAFSSDLTM
jgi:hypothetical protein